MTKLASSYAIPGIYRCTGGAFTDVLGLSLISNAAVAEPEKEPNLKLEDKSQEGWSCLSTSLAEIHWTFTDARGPDRHLPYKHKHNKGIFHTHTHKHAHTHTITDSDSLHSENLYLSVLSSGFLCLFSNDCPAHILNLVCLLSSGAPMLPTIVSIECQGHLFLTLQSEALSLRAQPTRGLASLNLHPHMAIWKWLRPHAAHVIAQPAAIFRSPYHSRCALVRAIMQGFLRNFYKKLAIASSGPMKAASYFASTFTTLGFRLRVWWSSWSPLWPGIHPLKGCKSQSSNTKL